MSLKLFGFIFILKLFSFSNGEYRNFYLSKEGVAKKGVTLDELAGLDHVDCSLACADLYNCEGYLWQSGVCELLTGPEGTGNISLYKG